MTGSTGVEVNAAPSQMEPSGTARRIWPRWEESQFLDAEARPGGPRPKILASILTLLLLVLGACGSAAPDTDPSTALSAGGLGGPAGPSTDTNTGQPPVQDCPATSAGPIVLAVAARSNNPDPAHLPPAATDVLLRAIDAGAEITVISDDGEPAVITSGAPDYSTANNDYYRQVIRDNFVTSLNEALAGVKAKTAGAAPLQALALAARQTRGDGRDYATIIMSDNMLSTLSPLDFTSVPLTASAQEVVAYLAKTGELPDLSGVTIMLTGVGDTQSPQEPLSVSTRNNLVDIWRAIATAAGARCVTVVDVPNSAPGQPQNVSVPTVPVPSAEPLSFSSPDPQGAIAAPQAGLLPDDAVFGFNPDSADLRNPDDAGAALRPLADWLAAADTNHLKLTGTTARVGDEAGQIDLSSRRADAIKALLLSLNQRISAAQIDTEGVGSNWPGYTPDHDADGNLLPVAAANRTVIVTPSTT